MAVESERLSGHGRRDRQLEAQKQLLDYRCWWHNPPPLDASNILDQYLS
jgi:hypothetical protein